MLYKIVMGVSVIAMGFASMSAAIAKDKFDANLVKAAQKEGKVVVYHSLNRKAVKKVAKAYEKKFKVEVHLTRKGTGGVIKMISAEGAAGGLKCDVVSAGEQGVFLTWRKKGLIQPYKSMNDGIIYKKFRDSDNYTTTVRQNFYGIAYSTKLVKKEDAPKDWEDILNPKWKGKIGVINPKSAGPARLWLSAMVRKYGWGYIEKLSKLDPVMIKSSSTAAKMLVSGEVAFTLPGSEHGIVKRKVKKIAVEIVYPKSGILGKSSPIAICKGAKNINAAKLWIDFETSQKGQSIITKAHALLPIRPDVKAHHKRSPGVFDNALTVSAEHLRDKGPAERRKFEKIMKAGMK